MNARKAKAEQALLDDKRACSGFSKSLFCFSRAWGCFFQSSF